MGQEQVERRLAAILAGDVVGYSRLVEANEEARWLRFASIATSSSIQP